LRRATVIRALCEAELQAIRALGLRNPVAVIPNGMDLPPIQSQGGEGRGTGGEGREAGASSTARGLLFLGRLHPKKGLKAALRAWAEVCADQRTAFAAGRSPTPQAEASPESSSAPRWQFWIAGWDQGDHEAELKQLCKDLQLSFASLPASDLTNPPTSRDANVHAQAEAEAEVLFLGPAFGEIKDRLLRCASAFILPSFSEGLPMAVLEAWAYQLPVLMTRHCNLPEGFQARAAIQIHIESPAQPSPSPSPTRHQPDSPQADASTTPTTPTAFSITQGLQHLIHLSDSERHQMGQNARHLVETRFTWPLVAQQMKAVYDWLQKATPAPDCVHF